jgi:hypothetical protein
VTVTRQGLKDAAEEKGPIPPWTCSPVDAAQCSHETLKSRQQSLVVLALNLIPLFLIQRLVSGRAKKCN